MQPTDQLVSKVPSHIVASARPANAANGGRLADYNVAVWLHLPGVAELPVTLLVSYRDGERTREVVIDHGTVNGQSRILLSGIARLPFSQRIEDAQIKVRSAIALSRVIAEEVFMQAVEQQPSSARPLVTSL
ncbi:hypothetical protein JVX91_26255 [Pseudomonas sp. PDNC002]|uniref:hypothetical protein n=1 Tax=Pseudomonas sp. PDNC002 TaxID=2811422 RepID=UPI001964DB0B|nr:hypothetical protein [Pseudomonas sp. PDNC002]QRY79031.1 hypothetical protein JVX91_26255 [Pseudomonas sp. PDNC002]